MHIATQNNNGKTSSLNLAIQMYFALQTREGLCMEVKTVAGQGSGDLCLQSLCFRCRGRRMHISGHSGIDSMPQSVSEHTYTRICSYWS